MRTEERPAGTIPILGLEVRYEHDVVAARQRARHIAELMGFDAQDQARIATATSEIVRNAFRYAHGGRVEFLACGGTPAALKIRVSDQGPGIVHLQEVLDGRYRSETGMGMGIMGTRRLMDDFSIESAPGQGTTVSFARWLPVRVPELQPARVARITEELARTAPDNPYDEIQRQNSELLRALEELRLRQEELTHLNQELEDTNRGVVALYAELDERASYLRRVSDLKSRFLSNMSHEFRTPLNSILSLTRMLLSGTDGPLNEEQERQVTFVRRSAEDLSELVNDLLDLAKVEAGKLSVRPEQFAAHDLFRALRGMLKPLTEQQTATELIFEEPADLPTLHTDEGKISQILRNFISNALKFTPSGEVRVSARRLEGGVICFSVADTGIGIAGEDLERIFEEFSQVENPFQRKVKGTGLGLPLSRKLAELLGGRVQVESEPGRGSTFSLEIPMVYGSGRLHSSRTAAGTGHLGGNGEAIRVLLIDDDEVARYVLRSQLTRHQISVVEAAGGIEGLRMARELRPDAIFLDLAMPDMHGLQVLDQLKSDDLTRSIPVVIYTSMTVSAEHDRYLAESGARLLKKGVADPEAPVRLVKEMVPGAEGMMSADGESGRV